MTPEQLEPYLALKRIMRHLIESEPLPFLRIIDLGIHDALTTLQTSTSRRFMRQRILSGRIQPLIDIFAPRVSVTREMSVPTSFPLSDRMLNARMQTAQLMWTTLLGHPYAHQSGQRLPYGRQSLIKPWETETSGRYFLTVTTGIEGFGVGLMHKLGDTQNTPSTWAAMFEAVSSGAVEPDTLDVIASKALTIVRSEQFQTAGYLTYNDR